MQVERSSVRITPSLVNTARQCGHRLAWERRHPELRRPFVKTAATARGDAVHAALAEFHRTGGAAAHSFEDLRGLLARCWSPEPYADDEECRVARLQCETELEAYYERFGGDAGTLATERTWSLLRDLDGLCTEWSGRLDWVRETDPGQALEVVDWKTGGQVPSEEALAADPAVVIYSRLAHHLVRRQRGWSARQVAFSLLFVPQLRKVTVRVTREVVRAAESELAVLARGFLAGELPVVEGPWCQWGPCPVREAGECPLFPAPELDEGEW